MEPIKEDLIEQCQELQQINNTLWQERERYRKRLAVVEAASERAIVLTWALVLIIAGLIAGHIYRSAV